MRDSGYVPTRRLSVVVMTATGVWIDDHPLPLPAGPRVHDAVLDVLARGARRRGTRLTARVLDRVAGGTLTIEVRPDGASSVLRLPDPEENATDGRPAPVTGDDEAAVAETWAQERTARRRHLEGAYREATALWLALAERSMAWRRPGTANHLARAAAAWQRSAPGTERAEHARRLVRCWQELADTEGLGGTDRELWRGVYAQHHAVDGAGKGAGGGSLPEPPRWSGRSTPEIVVHSSAVGGFGAPTHCVCFLAACGSALDHGATTEMCPWHTGRPVQQYHLSSRCPSGAGGHGRPGGLTDSATNGTRAEE